MTQGLCQALLTKYSHIMTELKKLEGHRGLFGQLVPILFGLFIFLPPLFD